MEKTPDELAAETAQQEAEQKAQAEAEAKLNEEKSKLLNLEKDELYKIIQETRSEAKERRLKEKELTEKLSEFEKKQEEANQKDLKSKGKHEEIIAELNKKLSELEPAAKEHREYVDKRKETLKLSLEEKGIWIESFTTLNLSALEELDNKSKPKTPTDSGKNFHSKANTNGNENLTPEEKMVSGGIYK